LNSHVVEGKLRLPDLSHEPSRTLVINDHSFIEERNPSSRKLRGLDARVIGATRLRSSSRWDSTCGPSKQSMCQQFHQHHLSSEGTINFIDVV
jgi:hypothetical protein